MTPAEEVQRQQRAAEGRHIAPACGEPIRHPDASAVSARLGVDLGTPWLALPHSARVPPDPEHLPERVGLFTLILFGEAVVAVMHGMESQEGWTPAAAAAAFLSMAWIFLIWWWYFDVASASSARVVRDRHDEVRFHLWTFAHFPFYLGYVVMAAGLRQIVTAADRTMLSGADTAVMASATSLLMVSIAVIAATAAHRPRWESPRRAVVVLAAATGLAGFALPALDPVAAIALLLTACAGQIALTSARQKRAPVTSASHEPVHRTPCGRVHAADARGCRAAAPGGMMRGIGRGVNAGQVWCWPEYASAPGSACGGTGAHFVLAGARISRSRVSSPR